jgi:hypothetical protein
MSKLSGFKNPGFEKLITIDKTKIIKLNVIVIIENAIFKSERDILLNLCKI